MALPYATEDQLNQLKVQLEKKINTGGGASGEIPTKLSQLTNDTGFITETALTDYALKSELPDVSDLEWIPVICNMNFRNLADKVYSQEEIFAWFFVENVVGLKNLVLKHPVYLRFGISLSGNPKYYYIPCQYVAFIDANTVEMITDGLDTRNDKFSRYHITIKLDGTVINGASNIKVELKENVFVPDLPEDADTKTYQLKAVNGTLTWIE